MNHLKCSTKNQTTPLLQYGSLFIGAIKKSKMKLYTTMPKALIPYYRHELDNAATQLRQNNLQLSWYYLERAHILGQPYPVAHTAVHWKMFLFGIKIKSTKEVLGQITRLVFGGVKSFVGKVPIGNTGGANVPPLKPMEIPEDLKLIIQENS